MGLSGLVGGGAAEGLEDILARQMLEQQMAERERAQRAQESLASQRLSQDASQHGDLMGLRGRELDQRDMARRDESNRAGVEDLERQGTMMAARDAQAKLEEELNALMGDPTVPGRVKGLAKAGRLGIKGVSADDFATDAERDAEGTRRANQVGAEAEARARAEARYRKPDAPPRPAVMTPGQKFQATQSLRKSFDMESRAAREVAMQLSQMQAGIGAARKGDMAAGSQAVLVTFQKILDPASVVRESEYARSSSGQALLSRIQGAVEQLRVGGASIPVDELERFVSLANTFAENQARAAMDSKEQIEAVAMEYGIDPKLVTRDIQAPGNSENAPAASPAPAAGVTHVWQNGKLVKVGG